ncbi:MAG: dTMP kinase [Pseudomonadota bacterium]
MRARFITLEGLDGAGKTTQLHWISQFLTARSLPLCVTREPGGTPLGETLRDILLNAPHRLHTETEALLMFAARREHIDKVIAPALERGTWVLCDRFTDASFAYQSGGSAIAWEKIEMLETWVQGALQPDLTLYLDVSPEVGRTRAASVKTPDRYEQEQGDFHERTRAAYLRRGREHPDRIRIIDANGSETQVQSALREILTTWCEGVA